jgi:hypothetical protein
MNVLRWFVEALLVIEGIGVRVGTTAGRLIKLALGLALVWPLAIIGFGTFPHEIARILVPIETLAPFVCLIAAIFAMNPFRLALGTAAILTPPARKFLFKLSSIIGIELVLGIYFTVVPVSNNLSYLPLLVLLLVSFLFLHGKMRTAAIVIFVILTIGFFYNFEKLGEKIKGTSTKNENAGKTELASNLPEGWQPDILPTCQPEKSEGNDEHPRQSSPCGKEYDYHSSPDGRIQRFLSPPAILWTICRDA